MDTRKPVDLQAMGLMALLCMVWGFQQVTLKATAAEIAPMLQIALRSGIAAVLVGAVMLWRSERLSVADGRWRPGLVVGGLFALEFLLVGQALRHTSASHTVVFLYSAPVFAALGLHRRLPAERLRPLQWLGIALAFAGLALAFFMRRDLAASGPVGARVWGDLLALLGGMAWGATTVVVRCSRLAQAPATETLLYQLLGAFVLLMAAAALMGQTGIHFSPRVWASLAFQALVVSFASFLVWFWLLRKYLASQLGVFSFLTPLFGMAFGAWLLDEALEPSFLAGAALVLGGIVLVHLPGWLAQKRRTDAARSA